MKRCYWWNRWFHRKNRQNDLDFFLPSIEDAAFRWANGIYLSGTLEYKNAVDMKVKQALEIHKHLPGNEHWLCECAMEDAMYETSGGLL